MANIYKERLDVGVSEETLLNSDTYLKPGHPQNLIDCSLFQTIKKNNKINSQL